MSTQYKGTKKNTKGQGTNNVIMFIALKYVSLFNAHQVSDEKTTHRNVQA